jgi:hypothetical protein
MMHALWIFFLALSAQAGVMKLERFDQLKLAEFLQRLPETGLSRSSEELSGALEGKLVRNELVLEGLSLRCEARYYKGFSAASWASCEVEVQGPRRNQEYRIEVRDAELVAALRSAIPYGQNLKEFRSAGKLKGTTFEGTQAWIFDYYFACGANSCALKFSTQ